MKPKEELKTKCVTLKGELEDWGKHILMPMGVTLCGMPTVDVDKDKMPQLNHPNFKDMIFEYTEEEWDITCTRCLDMIDIVERSSINRTDIN